MVTIGAVSGRETVLENINRQIKGPQSSEHNSTDVARGGHLHETYETMEYPHFPTVLSPRTTLIPIKNKYEVVFPVEQEKNVMGTGTPDIFVMVFYRSDNTADITVRRLDIDRWISDVHLRIHVVPDGTGAVVAAAPGTVAAADRSGRPVSGNNANNLTATSTSIPTDNSLSELIIIPNTKNSSFVLQYRITTSKVKLLPLTGDELYTVQKIPRIIMQTYYTTNATNIYHWNAFQTFVDLNPEYEVVLMLDRHCRTFIKKHFPANVLQAYDSLVPKAFKADLFRYCYLYIKGGCYFDNKMINRVPLRNAVQPGDEFLVCSDTLSWGIPAKTMKDTTRFYNAVICSAPRDHRMLSAITQVVETVNSRNSRLSDLAITGPVAFYEATKDQSGDDNLRFQHEMGRHPYVAPWSPQGHSVGRQYRDYYVREKLHGEVILTKFFQGYYSSTLRRYGDLWNQGKVYYESDHLSWDGGRWKLFIEPGILPYYSVVFDPADGSIVVEKRSLFSYFQYHVLYGLVVEETKSLIRKRIIKYGDGGLTDKIELKLVDDESSQELYLHLDTPTATTPRTIFNTQAELTLRHSTSSPPHHTHVRTRGTRGGH